MRHLNPKERFKAKKDFLKEHQDLVVKESFLEALQTTLAEMTMQAPTALNPSQNWDAFNRITGAKEFMSILLNLGEAPKKLPPAPSDNLNYQTK